MMYFEMNAELPQKTSIKIDGRNVSKIKKVTVEQSVDSLPEVHLELEPELAEIQGDANIYIHVADRIFKVQEVE